MTPVAPASDWCQRWNDRQHSWRHVAEGGFDQRRYEVAAIDEVTAKRYVVANHYSGTYPSALSRYGLFESDRLVGVLVLSAPSQAKVLTNVYPDLEPYYESKELGRLVLEDEVPGNGETFFIAQAFRLDADRGLRGVVSFADPVPRRVGGDMLFPGHIGTIYQAGNAEFLGRATARLLTLLPDGTTLNARARQKVVAGERGRQYTIDRLVEWGASSPARSTDMSRWLTSALAGVGATRLRHGGNFRYGFRVGRTKAEKRRVRIAIPAGPYPKQRDEEAA
jgi:hypothetical protein